MCLGNNCPLKETCLRFKGERNPYGQSMFTKVPLKEDNTCDYYYEISKKTLLTKEEE